VTSNAFGDPLAVPLGGGGFHDGWRAGAEPGAHRKAVRGVATIDRRLWTRLRGEKSPSDDPIRSTLSQPGDCRGAVATIELEPLRRDHPANIDLLFYHRKLRRLVALDLKLERFKAADKGQAALFGLPAK
jgi:hypothetical protein